MGGVLLLVGGWWFSAGRSNTEMGAGSERLGIEGRRPKSEAISGLSVGSLRDRGRAKTTGPRRKKYRATVGHDRVRFAGQRDGARRVRRCKAARNQDGFGLCSTVTPVRNR